ncbi:MAG TPA: DNA helicase RecG [Persephonella sp.]|uniref:ATP-dependent DNA helicase RecG n=1 Tax=Persephonella marina (strain DSM 14350 / EX-H1) TaxID=123214 RepID=C0QQE8_PERMH|nr:MULTISPECIES: ATP-dependent DNA helicase RecG [Persephonella]ACO03137.1 ATP-dependent DNA helicase RecG [Persephonella marina EX-H1]HCB69500.1 DNA helicase RecG [Persephonella sp.]
MRNLNTAKQIIDKALSSDDILLERITGLSETLNTLLEGYIPEGFIQDLKDLDKLPVRKKRAFLDYLSKAVEEALNTYRERSEEKKEDTYITFEELKNITVSDLKILKPIEKRAFKKVGIGTVYNTFFFPPKKYEDRRLKKLGKIKDGEYGLFEVEVVDIKKIKRGKLKTELTVKQERYFMKVYFVHDKPFLFSFFRKGKKVLLYGKVSVFKKDISMVQPEIFTDFDPVIHDRIVPVYSLKGDSTVKITSQTINHLRRGIFKILKSFLRFHPEYIPADILKRHNFPDIKSCIKNLHFPEKDQDIESLNSFRTVYQRRLIFDDLFILQLAQMYRKNLLKSDPAERITVSEGFIDEFESKLPFELTEDQRKAIKEILSDISKTVPMNRLVQGDVGSGKTVVAAASVIAVALDNKQTAVMAPTEILAAQHYRTFKDILKNFGITPYLLTGSIPQKDKKKIYRLIQSGEAKVVIGTHALIQDELKFKNLSLVVVDEQHRFGVIQRKALIEKSHKVPHTLIMTATPIPRTMQIASFGDLDISTIKQLPKGRKPVETVLIYDDEKKILYRKVSQEIEKGRQVFVVYPLIEESEKIDLKSAEEGYEQWKKAFPDKKILLLHGKMPQEEKDRIMESFRKGEADILVSTTVIEVGVDIPNASVMVIEEAHRFGLSQIHQLRGRIGRGQYEGYCYLVLPSRFKRKLENRDEEKRRVQTVERLKILVKTNDGFRIAEEDLKIRGGGDIAGTAQSGRLNIGIADLSRDLDRKILQIAKDEAQKLIEKDPYLRHHTVLKEIVFERYADRFDLVNVG